ncbi:MAG: hypothetical protein R2781_05875 [Flavobacteriaceae bacterium]
MISNKRRVFEILGVVVTALGKFVFMDYLHWRFQFVATAILIWGIYVFSQKRNQPKLLHYWGFRGDNFKSVARFLIPFGLLAILGFLVVGFYKETLQINWHILPILITYPIWGLIQQFLIMALVAGNLEDLNTLKLPRFFIVLFTATLFSGVHYPQVWLIIATFVMALLYGFIYLKNRNLYALGLFHGWLGAIFYYTVLGENPFRDIFLKLFYS